jgi:glycosyltransferase involved in cell wall biosynthesis
MNMEINSEQPAGKNGNSKISIIVPAYNEVKGIKSVLDGLLSLDKGYEIIVVDDGSGDDTAEVVKPFSNVRLIRHEYNLGYGAALKTGIRSATGDIIIITDADGTYPYNQIPVLADIINDSNCAMVVGARNKKNVKIPLVRRPAKWCLNRLANYLSGIRIPDLNSGLRAMRRPVVEKFFHLLPDGFSLTTTITLAMLTNGYSVKYISIDYFKREGKSKIHPIKDTLNFIQLIIRTVLYFNPLRVFIPFSVSLVILSFLVLFLSGIFTEKAMDVTFGVILMSAVIVMAIGMLADLIDKRIQ